MKFSQFFIPTTKEAPKDALLPSHQYLVRGGFVNQVSSGIYNYLPMGKIVLDKIKKIIKEELDTAGCFEVELGFVTPSELWKESGRYEKYGKELLRIKDRKEMEFVLGPTHEEMMVELVKNRVTSYKNLPLNLYQIKLKFRDEARPRFGLLRGREFLMKDGYSFHASVEDMVREFNLMEETYKKIFKRLGLEFKVVEADSGAIGGTGSKEFMVLADSGEDTIVACKTCDYGANIEAAKRVKRTIENKKVFNFEKVLTPGIKSIDEVSKFFGVFPSQTIKAVIKKALYDDNSEIVVFFLRGDDVLEETKACNSINANELVDATEEEIGQVGLCAGFVGPLGLSVKSVIDNELINETNMICGANENDTHLSGVSLVAIDTIFDDLIEVEAGDNCICCGAELYHTKGIEVGHIFQLGTRYSDPLKANFLDENGKSKPFIMGTYGIGVSRLLSAIIEQHHDEKGCIWTKETAPFVVDIIVSNAKNEDELNAGAKLYKELNNMKISTILDDRKNERFGFKIGDFELIGFSYAIIIGKKLENDVVEIVSRDTLEKIEVPYKEAVATILELMD